MKLLVPVSVSCELDVHYQSYRKHFNRKQNQIVIFFLILQVDKICKAKEYAVD